MAQGLSLGLDLTGLPPQKFACWAHTRPRPARRHGAVLGGDLGRLVRRLVQDSSRSLSPEQPARQFQPLQRTVAKPCAIAGRGIGLALNRRIAEMTGGGPGLDSRLDHGNLCWAPAASIHPPHGDTP